MKGNPQTLFGLEAKGGDLAPDFEVLTNSLIQMKFLPYKGKAYDIFSIP